MMKSPAMSQNSQLDSSLSKTPLPIQFQNLPRQSQEYLFNILKNEELSAGDFEDSPRFASKAEIHDFLSSLFSDKQWSQVATEDQFNKIFELLGENYGLYEKRFTNKYENLPNYILAQKEMNSMSHKQSNHIGGDFKESKNVSIGNMLFLKKEMSVLSKRSPSGYGQATQDQEDQKQEHDKEEKMFEKMLRHVEDD